MTTSPPTADAEEKQEEEVFQEQEFSYELKIPKDRVAVLIGVKGQVKKSLEDHTKVKIDVDSKEGEVTLTGKDSLALYSLREVIKAIGRGFNPEIAQLLLKQDYSLELIQIQDYVKNKNHIQRLRGRVIGAGGKARATIEQLTECFIVIYGKTIGIIGTNERAGIAYRAVESILEGSPHANVYRWLEKSCKQLKRREALNI